MDSSPPSAPPSQLQTEIRQTRPFQSLQQEALLSVQRTASLIERASARVLSREELSTAQYNVLRILRGAGPEGLPTLAIRDRMIDPGAAITRLVDRLVQAELVTRERGSDRRMVHCRITTAGLDVLARLDPVMTATADEIAGKLPPEELRALIDVLAHLRSTACEGKSAEEPAEDLPED